MPRLVENPSDRLPADNVVAHSLARLGAKGEKGYFQLITENNDTPKQVTDIIKGVTNIVLKVPPAAPPRLRLQLHIALINTLHQFRNNSGKRAR